MSLMARHRPSYRHPRTLSPPVFEAVCRPRRTASLVQQLGQDLEYYIHHLGLLPGLPAGLLSLLFPGIP